MRRLVSVVLTVLLVLVAGFTAEEVIAADTPPGYS